ncbi:hypothetical protein [Methylobacterium sp. J-070]|uniref:hypothetical protein n=1 Tax=Methylobacterium sp. J-070 TaxID=2836650 RepID=UPI001FBA30D9|nr:hypothetical protein [Methylobacterium sp. J-070]MCJ2052317.1 hypothetical protein [Methylobacterium sp. J-070]
MGIDRRVRLAGAGAQFLPARAASAEDRPVTPVEARMKAVVVGPDGAILGRGGAGGQELRGRTGQEDASVDVHGSLLTLTRPLSYAVRR